MDKKERGKKVKDLGQVFTPPDMVKIILDASGYSGENILKKHVIDNSCGQGAFLVEIVDRYVREAKRRGISDAEIVTQLEEFIHGIELDKGNFLRCKKELDAAARQFGIISVKWDLQNADATSVRDYDGRMDFVVGNPPYVRVHNLHESLAEVKRHQFCQSGMTDLYYLFFEIGFNMLNNRGRLGYIVPNSCYNSLAGREFRRYIRATRHLYRVMDVGHYQPFIGATAYTTILCFDKSQKFDKVAFYKFGLDGSYDFIRDIEYQELFYRNDIVLAVNSKVFAKVMNYSPIQKDVEVKNAFATLKDDVFFSEQFEFDECVIDAVKASKGAWEKCLFPYDNDGRPLAFDEFKSEKLKEYLLNNEEKLRKRKIEKRSAWYLFGRSQGIKDVRKRRIAINTIIRDVNSIKLTEVEPGQGIYSGLYMLTDVPYNEVEAVVKNDEFVDYIMALNKCKSGGYYTFSSKDLSAYVNYKLSERRQCV